MTSKITRRHFLMYAGSGLGMTALAFSGLVTLGMQDPVNPSYENFPSGENNVNQKVLVTYGSKAGSTMGVALAVANQITAQGLTVDICPVKYAKDIEGYSAVVIGSAIRMGQPLSEVLQFIEKNAAVLRHIPTAFFAVHLLNIGKDETSRKARLAYLDKVRRQLALRSEAFFAGVGDPSKVCFIDRLIFDMVKPPKGDFRDWTAIRGWAEELRLAGFGSARA